MRSGPNRQVLRVGTIAHAGGAVAARAPPGIERRAAGWSSGSGNAGGCSAWGDRRFRRRKVVSRVARQEPDYELACCERHWRKRHRRARQRPLRIFDHRADEGGGPARADVRERRCDPAAVAVKLVAAEAGKMDAE